MLNLIQHLPKFTFDHSWENTIKTVFSISFHFKLRLSFVLKQKKQKFKGVQNAPTRILMKDKCGRMISGDSSFLIDQHSTSELSGLTSPLFRIHSSRFDTRADLRKVNQT